MHWAWTSYWTNSRFVRDWEAETPIRDSCIHRTQHSPIFTPWPSPVAGCSCAASPLDHTQPHTSIPGCRWPRLLPSIITHPHQALNLRFTSQTYHLLHWTGGQWYANHVYPSLCHRYKHGLTITDTVLFSIPYPLHDAELPLQQRCVTASASHGTLPLCSAIIWHVTSEQLKIMPCKKGRECVQGFCLTHLFKPPI